MDTLIATQCPDRWWTTRRTLLGSLGLMLLVLSCSGGGNNGTLDQGTPPPSARSEEQAITQLLALYRTARLEEDIDRLAELLSSGSAGAQFSTLFQQEGQATARGSADAPTFLADSSAAFRTRTITALDQEAVEIAADRRSVSFLEVESAINPATLEQQTRLVRTIFQLIRDEVDGVVAFRIATVQHTPLATVTTPGQVQAGALTRVQVTGTDAEFALAGVEVTVPETGLSQGLTAQGQENSVRGLFTPPVRPDPQPLRVRIEGSQGNVLTFSHRYRLRVPGEGAVHQLAGTGTARFFAVAIAPDSTAWAGGLEPPLGGGTLYQVPAGATMARLVGDRLEDPAGRVEDLTFDHLGRLHAIVRSTGSATFAANSRDDVRDRDIFCSTVNVFDPAQSYPLLVLEPRSGNMVPSPSTRVVAAGEGDVWLHGSDGGVARVADTFREGVCPASGVAVRYDPVFRRETSALPTNSVPALAVGADGALWFGTALGLTRFRDGQFTPVPFNRTLALSQNVATLEQFFQAVAEAIFAARPLTTVAVGNVSFVEAFGRALVKEDLIFSAVEDARGRLWAGTLGGGIRRIEAHSGTFRDTLHLTRAEIARVDPETGARTVVASPGIGSNIIFALAVSPDGALWAATEEGVSRIQERDGTVVVTNFSALDGLALPVRDVAIDALGTAWLATDGGLFRIVPVGGTVRGVVRDIDGRTLVDADILVRGTPFRAVTDATGRFEFTNLPPGQHTLRFDSTLVAGGPFTVPFRVVDVSETPQMLEVTVVPLAPRISIDPVQGGVLTFSNAPGARLDIPPQALQLPAGEEPALGLTPLPLDNLPLPLPAGFTAVAAVDLQPSGTSLTIPAQLTLPNTAQLPAGRLVVLLRLNEAVPAYEEVGRGRVSDDGTIITTIGGGLSHFSAVVFVTTPVTDGARLVVLGGDGQSGTVGQPLASPFIVSVQDQDGQGIPEVPVTLHVLSHIPGRNDCSNDGSLTTTTALSDTQGRATSLLTLGTCAGTNLVEVRTAGLDPVIISATGRGDRRNARLIEVPGGNNQMGMPGQELPEPLVVRLEDQFQNPLAGEEVMAEILRGQAQFLSPAVVLTNDQGEAAFRLQPLEMQDVFVEMTALQAAPVQFRISLGSALAMVGYHIAVDADGTFLVVDPIQTSVRRLDPLTGESTPVSGFHDDAHSALRGTGIMFAAPLGVAVDVDRALVVVDLFQGVIRIDPATGDRTPVSGCADDFCSSIMGQGPPGFPFFQSIAVEASGTLVVVDAFLGVIRIDPTTGDRTPVSGCIDDFCSDTRGSGPLLVLDPNIPSRLITDPDGSLIVIDAGMRAVVRINPETGDRAIVSSDTIGTGRSFVSPRGIAREAQGTFVVVDVADAGTVVRVNPATGDRTVVSGSLDDQNCLLSTDLAGNGPCFDMPDAIAVAADRSLLAVDASLAAGAVVRIDPVSGNRRIVSFLRE